jgi:hypothetical protein
MISMLIIKCRKASCSGDRFYNTYMHVKTEMFGALICMNVHQNSMTSDIHPYKNSKLNPPMQPPEVWCTMFRIHTIWSSCYASSKRKCKQVKLARHERNDVTMLLAGLRFTYWWVQFQLCWLFWN